MLLTMAEVAKELKTNVTYVHRLRKAGLLPCIKLGAYKCRREALKAFLEQYEGYDLTVPEDVKRGDAGEIISASN